MRAMDMQRISRGQHGFSLIEIMIGLVIGMIAVLVIYQIFAAAEGIKRNTTSVGDAQQNGLLSSFMLSIELANASNGVSNAMQQFGTCTPTADIATTFSPIPILITDGVLGPDQFVVNYSQSNVVVAPVPFFAPAAADADYSVVSPIGFKAGDIVVAISGAGICETSQVTGVTAPDPGTGAVTISHSIPSQAISAGGYLVNMGRSNGGTQRVLYDVSNGVLRSSVLWNAFGKKVAAPIPNPLASNIVTMKLQYYVFDPLAGTLSWVNATGPWSAAALLALAPPTNVTTLQRIRAVRIGMVVQGEQFDDELRKQMQAAIPAPKWKLFGGGGTLEGLLTPGFRYRTYETVVPLRNPVWNL